MKVVNKNSLEKCYNKSILFLKKLFNYSGRAECDFISRNVEEFAIKIKQNLLDEIQKLSINKEKNRNMIDKLNNIINYANIVYKNSYRIASDIFWEITGNNWKPYKSGDNSKIIINKNSKVKRIKY